MKKLVLLKQIKSRHQALKIAKDCGNGLLVVAAIQGGIGILMAPALILDALLFGLCGFFLRQNQHFVVAVVALLLSGLGLIAAFLNLIGQKIGGGNNIFLALIIVVIAARAFDATLKLQNQFKLDSQEAMPN